MAGMDRARPNLPARSVETPHPHSSPASVLSGLKSVDWDFPNRTTHEAIEGVHPYPAKFVAELPRTLLTILPVPGGTAVFDPFCGSGTTLVECAHIGAEATGTDLNPFAVFIANAKLQALKTSAEALRDILNRLRILISRTRRWCKKIPDDPRGRYLQSWFVPDILSTIEILRAQIEETAGPCTPIFLAIISNLLREYSQQDPHDLRIRRRKSPLPDRPFSEAFLAAADRVIRRLSVAQDILGIVRSPCHAKLCDVTKLDGEGFAGCFKAAVTSPPYAMALPYIDTHRLSLVWLNLLPPNRVPALEAALIGSREIRESKRRALLDTMESNASALPEGELRFCLQLRQALGPADGFRRRAVPFLLYRYFVAMQNSFRSVQSAMKPGAPYALIVGHNHTVLGGVRFAIDTPAHLASIARHVGWRVSEFIPLQTYRRYGYHVNNAVAAETLLLLRAP